MFKKNVVIRAKRISPKFKLNIDYKTLVFFTLMICGVIIGVFISENGSDEWHAFFSNIVNGYLSSEHSGNILVLFYKLFLPFFLLYLITYIIGLCGMGIPFLSLIPLTLGVFFGIEIAHYYINYGLTGIGCCTLIYMPVYAIATATLIKRCCHCFDISGEIFIYLVTGKGDNKPILKDFTLKHLFFLLPIVAGAILSALSFKMFGDLFTFI